MSITSPNPTFSYSEEDQYVFASDLVSLRLLKEEVSTPAIIQKIASVETSLNYIVQNPQDWKGGRKSLNHQRVVGIMMDKIGISSVTVTHEDCNAIDSVEKILNQCLKVELAAQRILGGNIRFPFIIYLK